MSNLRCPERNINFLFFCVNKMKLLGITGVCFIRSLIMEERRRGGRAEAGGQAERRWRYELFRFFGCISLRANFIVMEERKEANRGEMIIKNQPSLQYLKVVRLLPPFSTLYTSIQGTRDGLLTILLLLLYPLLSAYLVPFNGERRDRTFPFSARWVPAIFVRL